MKTSAVLALLLLLSVTACSGAGPDPDTAVAQLSGYNHTPEYIHQYYVDGQYGGNVQPYGGGGSFVCCIAYPRIWRPDLLATVKWTTSDANPKGSPEETWHEKVVPIERYEQTGTRLNVHFLEDGSVRLIVSNGVAGLDGYPGPDAPEMPADYPYQ